MDGKITLGGQDYTVLPLSLGQMRAIGIGLLERADPYKVLPPPPGGAAQASETDSTQQIANERATWDRMLTVVAAALSRHHPEMTLEALLASDATISELASAYWDVLKLAGLIKVDLAGEATPAGETAPAAAGSPGAGSTLT